MIEIAGNERYRIGDLVLDVAACRLSRDQEEITLPKLSFDVLTVLARRAPAVTTNAELMDEVWGSVVVNEETVVQRIKLLRDALHEGNDSQRYIQTVRGRGYKMAVPVEALADEKTPDRPSPTWTLFGAIRELKRRRVFHVMIAYTLVAWIVLQVLDIVVPELMLPDWTMRLVLVLLVAGFPVALVLTWAFQMTPEGVVRETKTHRSANLLVGAGALLAGLGLVTAWWLTREPLLPGTSSDRRGVAVLPFKDMSPQSDQAYFSDGIHEELLSRLAETGAFRVPSRTSVEVYRDTAKNAREIAQDLRVDVVLEGSVRHAEGRVRIAVQLIDGQTDDHLWTQDYDRALSMENLFAIQRDVANAIARNLHAELSSNDAARLQHAPTNNLTAYDLFLKGVYHYRRFNTTDLRAAVDYLERATKLDPGFAAAWSALANTYALAATGYGWLEPDRAMRLAREYGTKALQLDSTRPGAVSLIGDILFWYERDWRGAVQEYDRALAFDPRHVGTRLSYAYLLSALNHHDEAIAHIRQCIELEPRSPHVHANAVWRYLNARQYDLAIAHADMALNIDSSFSDARVARSYAYIFTERLDEALVDLRELDHPDALGFALAKSGRLAEAREQLARLETPPSGLRVNPMALVIVLSGLGEVDKAYEWLDRAVEGRHRDALLLNAWEVYDPLRTDPRFAEFLVRLGLRNE